MTYIYHGIMTTDYNRTDVFVEHICTWMSHCTHHSDMDTPQYANVYVPSGILFHWMFNYTLHTYMDAPQCVHEDV